MNHALELLASTLGVCLELGMEAVRWYEVDTEMDARGERESHGRFF
jgi:hypothetical protein